jgi:phosphoglycolate phosphatase
MAGMTQTSPGPTSTQYEAVMFDLDGTLADTLADIAAVGNHALGRLGLAAIPVEKYRFLAGQGIRRLISDALGPEHQDLVPEAVELARAYQLEHGLDHARLYPGIAQLLDELTRRKLKTAVLSNKPHPATQVAVAKLLGNWRFDAVAGQREGVPLKPDPRQALEIAERLAVPAPRWLYLGDTAADMRTAVAARFHPVGVLWGFREEAELRANGARTIIAHPLELLKLLD